METFLCAMRPDPPMCREERRDRVAGTRKTDTSTVFLMSAQGLGLLSAFPPKSDTECRPPYVR